MTSHRGLETLFLDAGGVLVFPNWDRVSQALARRGVDVAPRALAEADRHARRELDAGTTVNRTNDKQRGWLYFNLVLDHAGVTQDERTDAALAELEVYHREANLWELVPPEVMPALARFRRFGLRLVVVSNANGKLPLLFERIGLATHVDLMLDSALEGVEKPDPALFRIALARAGAHPESTAHVGDLYHVDVVGARAAGLRAVLLDPGSLYPDADCTRVASLTELADRIEAGELL